MFHHLRNKLAVAFAVPLVLLLVVAGVAVSSSVSRSASVSQQTNLATATAGPSGVITALQNERNEAALSLVGAANAVKLGWPATQRHARRPTTRKHLFAASSTMTAQPPAKPFEPHSPAWPA